MKIRKIPLIFISAAMFSCGVNTDEPVYPLFTLFTPVQTPAIVSATPVETWTPENQLKMQFDVRYYITNQENEFMGYNLITSTTSTSAQDSGLGSVVYLPSGVEPSFLHNNTAPSTFSKDLITQRIADFKAAPSPVPFAHCEKYFFRLQAVTSNGIKSNTSTQVESCASTDINLCPKGTVCNP